MDVLVVVGCGAVTIATKELELFSSSYPLVLSLLLTCSYFCLRHKHLTKKTVCYTGEHLSFYVSVRIIYILLTKTTAARNEVALSYHKVRGLYFLAVVFEATIDYNFPQFVNVHYHCTLLLPYIFNKQICKFRCSSSSRKIRKCLFLKLIAILLLLKRIGGRQKMIKIFEELIYLYNSLIE